MTGIKGGRERGKEEGRGGGGEGGKEGEIRAATHLRHALGVGVDDCDSFVYVVLGPRQRLLDIIPRAHVDQDLREGEREGGRARGDGGMVFEPSTYPSLFPSFPSTCLTS